MSAMPNFGFIGDYWVDAWQRSILRSMRCASSKHFFEQSNKIAPTMPGFEFELVEGRLLRGRSTTCWCASFRPRARRSIPKRRPSSSVDPRAGHWEPGHRWRLRQESEIGVALAAAMNAALLVSFLPEPVAGQTIEDVCAAEAAFVEVVAGLHPDADGKLGGRRELPGGMADHDDGRDPARDLQADRAGRCAALPLGGRARPAIRSATWAAPWEEPRSPALPGDLGKGIFDGANPNRQLESLNPANTFWQKGYNLYSKVDTEASASSTSRPGGAIDSCSTPARCSGSPTICSSATS